MRNEEQRGRDATDKVEQERKRRKDAKLSYMMWANTKDKEAVKLSRLPGARNPQLGFGLPQQVMDQHVRRFRNVQRNTFKNAAKALFVSSASTGDLPKSNIWQEIEGESAMPFTPISRIRPPRGQQ